MCARQVGRPDRRVGDKPSTLDALSSISGESIVDDTTPSFLRVARDTTRTPERISRRSMAPAKLLDFGELNPLEIVLLFKKFLVARFQELGVRYEPNEIFVSTEPS